MCSSLQTQHRDWSTHILVAWCFWGHRSRAKVQLVTSDCRQAIRLSENKALFEPHRYVETEHRRNENCRPTRSLHYAGTDTSGSPEILECARSEKKKTKDRVTGLYKSTWECVRAGGEHVHLPWIKWNIWRRNGGGLLSLKHSSFIPVFNYCFLLCEINPQET